MIQNTLEPIQIGTNFTFKFRDFISSRIVISIRFSHLLLRIRITRLFCGNLNLKVNEEELKKCINGVKYIMWVTDKSTGQFYGSSFLEMKDPDAAAVAVQQDKSKFMGRLLCSCVYIVNIQ